MECSTIIYLWILNLACVAHILYETGKTRKALGMRFMDLSRFFEVAYYLCTSILPLVSVVLWLGHLVVGNFRKV